MKSFIDRADRKAFSEEDVNPLQHTAFQLQQSGQIDQACTLYEQAHREMVERETETGTEREMDSSGTNSKQLDIVTSDYGQMLEICCRHDDAITLLRSSLEMYALPQPSLCSVLLLKLLYIHPGLRTITEWNEMDKLYKDIKAASNSAKKTFKLQYKSHWAYFIMIQEALKLFVNS